MLYEEWLNEWLELYVKVSVKDRTYAKYRRQAEKYIFPALGGLDVRDLSAGTLQRFSASLVGRGLAPNSANFVISVLKASLRKGTLLGVADGHYADAIVRPKVRAGRVTCFKRAEQKKIEAYVLCKGPYLFGIVLALYTGLRIGELLALTWDDVDLGKRQLTVTKTCYDSWENGRYKKVLDTPKTPRSERVIPLPKQIVRYLRAIRKQTMGPFVVSARSEYGAQVRIYQRSFERVLGKLNIERKGFHALRHTFATRALEVGMDVKTLSEILGHSSPTVTLTRYAHSLMEHKMEMMEKVGRLLP